MTRHVPILVLLPLGCSPFTFHADHPGRTYPQTVKAASRLDSAGEGCDSIGTLTMSGNAEDDIEDIAAKVAELGGDHYVIRVNLGEASYETNAVAGSWGPVTAINARTRVRHDNARSVIDVLQCTSGPRGLED